MDKPNYVDLSTSNDYKIEDRFNNTHDSIGTESNSPQSVQNGGFFWSSNKSNNDSKCLIAARTKDYSVVDFMLNHEMISNLCTQDSNGNTLLHYLVKDSNTNSKAVSILNNVLGRKDLNNYINIQNNSGNTPLIDAVVSGNMKLCNNLIALGADKNIRNEEGLHVSAEQTDAAVQSGGISDNNYSPTSDFSVTEEQKDFNSLFVKDSAAFTASESNMPDKLTITESNVQSDVRNSDTFIRNLDNKLDSNNAPERNTEQFLNFLEQKYITGNQEGGVYTRHVKLGNRNLRYYGNEHSYEGSASDAELSRMIKNQASEIHDRVIKKIMELDKVDTGFGYMMEAYKIGGPYMHLITLMGLLILGVVVWKVMEIFSKRTVNFKLLDLILMAGSVALAIGLLSQIVGIVQALEAIRAAADISPQIVMGGAIVSFYAPIWGFIVFVFSLVFYFVLKEIIKAKLIE